MTRGQAGDSSRWDATRGVHTPRFRLKPTAHASGYVDGAWWPRSDDLTTELPGLIAVLSIRLGALPKAISLSCWLSHITATLIKRTGL